MYVCICIFIHDCMYNLLGYTTGKIVRIQLRSSLNFAVQLRCGVVEKETNRSAVIVNIVNLNTNRLPRYLTAPDNSSTSFRLRNCIPRIQSLTLQTQMLQIVYNKFYIILYFLFLFLMLRKNSVVCSAHLTEIV